MKLYRLITGPDDATFCHRVTEALNNGWELYGSPSLTYCPKRELVICGQAIVKAVVGEDYTSDLKLSEK